MARQATLISKERRSEIMRSIRRKNTPPELAVRRMVHGMGFRYRIHRQDLHGKPDIVLPRHRKIIFVHGCFWHGCPVCYTGARVPKSNQEFWQTKIKKNRARDVRSITTLESAGWQVLVIWECQTRDLPRLKDLLSRFLSGQGENQCSARQ
jgi:DNA mismatch endonuclease, patch repair protein